MNREAEYTLFTGDMIRKGYEKVYRDEVEKIIPGSIRSKEQPIPDRDVSIPDR